MTDVKSVSVPEMTRFSAPNGLKISFEKSFFKQNKAWREKLVEEEDMAKGNLDAFLMADSKASLNLWLNAFQANTVQH